MLWFVRFCRNYFLSILFGGCTSSPLDLNTLDSTGFFFFSPFARLSRDDRIKIQRRSFNEQKHDCTVRCEIKEANNNINNAHSVLLNLKLTRNKVEPLLPHAPQHKLPKSKSNLCKRPIFYSHEYLMICNAYYVSTGAQTNGQTNERNANATKQQRYSVKMLCSANVSRLEI